MTTHTLRLFVAALIAAAATGVSTAAAHSFPEAQSPSAGQALSTAPPRVTIRYNAPIEKVFANLQVVDADGKNVAAGAPQVSADGLTLSIELSVLTPGDYTVKWSVVGIDTHRTQGSYQFTVAGAAP